MPEGTVTIGETKLTFSGEADLSKFLDVSSPKALFEIVRADLVQSLDKTLEELDETELSIGLKVARDLKWDLGDKTKVTLGFSAGSEGSIVIKTSGDLLTYRVPDPEMGPEKVKDVPVAVPAGQAYFSVNLSVSLGVKGGAAFSSGSFGVKGSADGSGVSFRQGWVRPPDSRFLCGQDPPDRGSADVKPPGDLGFAHACAI